MIAMNVNQIITRALNVIRAESFYQQENQDARQFVLATFNDILAYINLNERLVPFNLTFDFTLTTGVSEYIVGTSGDATIAMSRTPSDITYVNLLLSGYSYPIEIVDNFTFKYYPRARTITGRPLQVSINAQKDAFKLTFYPPPDQAYVVSLFYRATVQYVTWQDSVALPDAYQAYLVYALAKRINLEKHFGMWTAEHESEFKKIEQLLEIYSQPDLRVRSVPPMIPYRYFYTPNLGVLS